MNFTPFSTSGAAGAATHFVTTGAHQFQGQVAKFQQNIGTGNGTTLGQVVGVVGGMGEGMQYVRTLEGGAQLQQATSQIITLPIALPGAKPGDPQQTMQIQVLNPNITLQQGVQQPKYHMQIPIQGFQQGGAVLTVAYAPDGVEGLQLLGNSLPEGLQVVAALQPQDLQMLQQQQQQQQEANKEQQGQQIQQQILIQNNQMIITQPQDDKKIINNNNNIMSIVKMEHDDTNDEESSELGAESGSEGGSTWQSNANQEIAKYLSKLPQQSQQALPASLQQFLRLNPDCVLKREPEHPVAPAEDEGEEILPDKAVEQVTSEEDLLKPKKKKKYKKKPLKPARPKPGQVVIAQAIDGTPIYCCPECQMAYPEKEQLELHLSVHKIERRFICGICGAGLKRKEHLERHKLGHNPERPYVCSICHKGFKRKEHLNLHTVIHSGEKTEVCQECGKGFYRKDHLRKHARSHQTRRAREETAGIEMATITPTPTAAASATQGMPSIEVKSLVSSANTRHTVMPEITIHVPTSANMQVPVQISVPHHIVSSLSNGQQHITINPGAQQHTINVEELLAQHS